MTMIPTAFQAGADAGAASIPINRAMLRAALERRVTNAARQAGDQDSPLERQADLLIADCLARDEVELGLALAMVIGLRLANRQFETVHTLLLLVNQPPPPTPTPTPTQNPIPAPSNHP